MINKQTESDDQKSEKPELVIKFYVGEIWTIKNVAFVIKRVDQIQGEITLGIASQELLRKKFGDTKDAKTRSKTN